MLSDFLFRTNLSSRENIDAFFEYLSGDNPEFANLLRENIEVIIPLTENQQKRTVARQTFNNIVKNHLSNKDNGSDLK